MSGVNVFYPFGFVVSLAASIWLPGACLVVCSAKQFYGYEVSLQWLKEKGYLMFTLAYFIYCGVRQR